MKRLLFLFGLLLFSITACKGPQQAIGSGGAKTPFLLGKCQRVFYADRPF
ncbi:MAG: hypothetical protein IPL27_13030 [Lewinellaceae bacterium]|nr:hypothetical protein [Lewinellaceae bacterium]